jgi:hypothetical protein
MLEPFVLGAVLVLAQPAPACPAYLPLPEALAAPAPRTPAAGMPSFPVPVHRSPDRADAPQASATLWLEVIDDDMPSFPIPVPRPGKAETGDTAGL